jgi:hypothetical protein
MPEDADENLRPLYYIAQGLSNTENSSHSILKVETFFLTKYSSLALLINIVRRETFLPILLSGFRHFSKQGSGFTIPKRYLISNSQKVINLCTKRSWQPGWNSSLHYIIPY